MTENGTIVVTGPYLDDAASTLMTQAGLTVAHTPAYPTDEVLVKFMVEHAPKGVISRMGQFGVVAMDAAPNLQVISKHGAGVDNIDIAAASERGILVLRAPGANALSVAEHTLALMLATIKQIVPLDCGLRANRWDKPGFLGREIAGMCLGLVGFGAIARHVARLARGFGLNVAAYDPLACDDLFVGAGVTRCHSLQNLFDTSDIISLHCPLLPATRYLINAETIAQMKPGSYLVNTARGGLVNEADLLAALQGGHIAGAGLDTFETEPPVAGNALLQHPAIVATPHVAGVTAAAGQRVGIAAVSGVLTLLSGGDVTPDRIVNPEILKNGTARLQRSTAAE
jgi:D-3-phosphoglycerate dehydrogenase